MSVTNMSGRDAEGYPLQGIDVVPERVSENRKLVEIKDNMTKLIGLLQEANRREEQLKLVQERQHRKYRALEQEYLALKYGHGCDDCIRVQDDVEDVIIPCQTCAKPNETIQSLQLKLEKARQEASYWQDCFETALQYDGRGHDGTGQ